MRYRINQVSAATAIVGLVFIGLMFTPLGLLVAPLVRYLTQGQAMLLILVLQLSVASVFAGAYLASMDLLRLHRWKSELRLRLSAIASLAGHVGPAGYIYYLINPEIASDPNWIVVFIWTIVMYSLALLLTIRLSWNYSPDQ